MDDQTATTKKPWIRGVNIGGGLLAERFITPYFFAVNSCQLEGDFCWYPGQIDAPPTTSDVHQYCDLYKCKPYLTESPATGQIDYPTDEWTLASSFPSRQTATRYFKYHWEHFITQKDVDTMQQAGVTHVRVPLPHYVLGNRESDEPWVDGGWIYFIRFVGWCRKAGIQVWPDVHTAPGSQNGFDNSGRLMPGEPTCTRWSESPININRTLQSIQEITSTIKDDGLDDVITGFGILNEPFEDCDIETVREFNRQAYDIVRTTLSPETAIYIGDMFHSKNWNDGYWIDSTKYTNTYLDSHYYHVFAQEPRALSPKQHIAYVCGKNSRDTTACCYEDYEYDNRTQPSQGISRIIGEWSASFDTLVVTKLYDVMQGISKTGEAPEYDRKISKPRQDFLRNFVEAQMVTYEARDVGISSGWFYWTLKMEGGAFAEWDFLRGVEEGWIPRIPDPSVDSQDKYGTCHAIASRTKDDMSIVNPFPDPSTLPDHNWQGVDIDDDYVVSHADSLTDDNEEEEEETPEFEEETIAKTVTSPRVDATFTDFKDFNPIKTTKTASEVPVPPPAADGTAIPEDTATNAIAPPSSETTAATATNNNGEHHLSLMPFLFFAFVGYAAYRVFRGNSARRQQHQYTTIDTPSSLTV